MILNGLDFHSRTLNMFSDFFETKPIARLLTKDVEAYHLTASIFLKKPERIESLLMIMTLSSLVYAESISNYLTSQNFFQAWLRIKPRLKQQFVGRS